MTTSRLEDLLIKHEGLKLKPYKDSVGKLTIGVGRNLDDNGISEEEALFMLTNDIQNVLHELSKFSWFVELNDAREDVLLNMAFNLGVAGLLMFKDMINALRKKDYEAAANAMLESKWSQQVKNRAYELAQMMRTGEYFYEP